MHIINSLTIQLETIVSLMKKDLTNDEVIYNYYIREDEYKFLNDKELNVYLLENKVENLYPLERVNNLCIEIRNYWNDNLGNKNAKEISEWISWKNEDGYRCGTRMDFHVLFLNNNKCHSHRTYEYNSLILKELNSDKYIRTNIHEIVLKSQKIKSILTNSYSELIETEEPKQWLIQYKNFKSLKIIPKTYKTSEYEIKKTHFDNHLFGCRYIYTRLEEKEQQEFKEHIINNLEEIKSIQVLDEFKKLITELIDLSNNNFEVKKNKNTKTLFYPKIGALFAQGLIYKKGFVFKYKDEEFESLSKLSNHIKKDVLKTENEVRQYIGDTLSNSGSKNIYSSKTMINNILKYCKENNINNITDEFKKKHTDLNIMH